MSHGPPPSANYFGFGTVAVGNLNGARPDGPNSQAHDSSSLISFLDTSSANSFNSFDTMAMNMDADDPIMSQAFSAVPLAPGHSAQRGSAQLDGPLFAEDEGASSLPATGPPPATGFGTQASAAGSSLLTDFTKRRNWSAKVIEELRDFLQILDANGRIKHVSPSITALTGYAPEDVLDQFLKDLIHPDDVGLFVAELNESIARGIPLRLFYRMKTKDGAYAIFEAVGHAHIAAARFAPNPHNQSPFCQAVFIMARAYPTKNAELLDSFLEHKIENERLRRRIAQLKKEELDEAEESQMSWAQTQEGVSDITPSDDATPAAGTPYFQPGNDAAWMPPPERPTPLNTALTRENLEGIAGSRPDSIKEKMARYEGTTQAEAIEMLTGLRYQEGERSRGMSAGNASPSLIKGDAGIAIPMDRDPRTGEKKKKVKLVEEYVCTDCGTLDSPEWRKGPSGPKTLCNACGLRWAKKEKKKNANGGGASGANTLSMVDPSG